MEEEERGGRNNFLLPEDGLVGVAETGDALVVWMTESHHPHTSLSPPLSPLSLCESFLNLPAFRAPGPEPTEDVFPPNWSLSLSLSLSPASHSAIKTHIFPQRSCWSYSNILQLSLPLNLPVTFSKVELSWEITRNNPGPSRDVRRQLNVAQPPACLAMIMSQISRNGLILRLVLVFSAHYGQIQEKMWNNGISIPNSN